MQVTSFIATASDGRPVDFPDAGPGGDARRGPIAAGMHARRLDSSLTGLPRKR